jgi:hypothetical protein
MLLTKSQTDDYNGLCLTGTPSSEAIPKHSIQMSAVMAELADAYV